MRHIIKQYIQELLAPLYKGMTQTVQQPLERQLTPIHSQLTAKLGTRQSDKTFAACVVITGPDGKFLGVSRKNDPNDFGFPGGHIELGETPREAAERELTEETGLVATDLHYLMKVPTKHGGFCAVYLCKAIGKIHTEEEGVVKWVSQDELLSGSFGSQNLIILKKLGLQN